MGTSRDSARRRCLSSLPLALLVIITAIVANLFTLSMRSGDAQEPSGSDSWRAEEQKCLLLLDKAAALEEEGKYGEAEVALAESTIGKMIDARMRLRRKKMTAFSEGLPQLWESIEKAEIEGNYDKAIAAIDEILECDLYLGTRKMFADQREKIVKAKARKGAPEVFVRLREGAGPVDLGKDKIILLPADAYGFNRLGLSEKELSSHVSAGMALVFHESGFILEPVVPALEAAGLDGLSQKLCYGAYHMVDFHDSFDLAADSCGEGIEDFPLFLSRAVELGSEKLKFSFKPRYVFGLYCWALGSGAVPGTVKCRIIAAVYDLEAKRVHSVVYYTVTLHRDLVPAKLAKVPEDAVGELIKAGAIKKG